MNSTNKRVKIIIIIIIVILLIPLIAMQFTDEVKWSFFDFIAAGILLLGTGLVCEFVMRKVKSTKQRIVICGIVVLVLILIWIELAVGIFGTPFAGN